MEVFFYHLLMLDAFKFSTDIVLKIFALSKLLGTHISNTREAKAFALLSEEGIAKGIRRITAVTTDSAFKAMELASSLEQEVDETSKTEGSLLEKVSFSYYLFGQEMWLCLVMFGLRFYHSTLGGSLSFSTPVPAPSSPIDFKILVSL